MTFDSLSQLKQGDSCEKNQGCQKIRIFLSAAATVWLAWYQRTLYSRHQ